MKTELGLDQNKDCYNKIDQLLDNTPRRFQLTNSWWYNYPNMAPASYYCHAKDAYDGNGSLKAEYRYSNGQIELFIEDDDFNFDFISQSGTLCSSRFREILNFDSDLVEYIPVDDSSCSEKVKSMNYKGLHVLNCYNENTTLREKNIYFRSGDFRIKCDEKVKSCISEHGLICDTYVI